MPLDTLTEIGNTLFNVAKNDSGFPKNHIFLCKLLSKYHASVRTLRECFPTLRNALSQNDLHNAARKSGYIIDDFAHFPMVASKEGWNMQTSYRLGQSKDMVKKHGLHTLIQFQAEETVEARLNHLLRLQIIILDEINELRFLLTEVADSLSSHGFQSVLNTGKAMVFNSAVRNSRWNSNPLKSGPQFNQSVDEFLNVQERIYKFIESKC